MSPTPSNTVERQRGDLLLFVSANDRARCDTQAYRVLADEKAPHLEKQILGIDKIDPALSRDRAAFVATLEANDDDRRHFDEMLLECAEEVSRIRKEKGTSYEADPNYLTDLGNAERFVAHHADHARYVPQWEKFLLWDGSRWKPDEVRAHVQLACETVRSLWQEAADAKDSTERASLAKHARESEREPRITALLRIATTDPRIIAEPEQLDANPWLLGVSNGVVNLRTGQLRQMSPEDLITKLAGSRFDPKATAPKWKGYLERVLGGDGELESYLQRLVGYLLTGLTIEQVFFFLYGLGGNGKSVFLTVLRWLLGDYAVSADSSTFLARQHEGPRTDIARLEGARLVTSLEAGENRRLDEELIKKITGGDVVTARKLYKAEREFVPQFKLLFAANHKPVISGTDIAIWRRVQLIPFTITIPEDERNRSLSDELKEELPGILNWAVEGCLLWQEQQLRPPQIVQAAVDAYRVESDTIGRFLSDSFELDPTAATSAKVIYLAYTRWAESMGEHRRLSANALGRKLTEKGIPSEKDKQTQTVYRLGIKVRDSGHEDSPEAPAREVDREPEHSRALIPLFGNSSFRARKTTS